MTDLDPDLTRSRTGLVDLAEEVGLDPLGVGELPGLHGGEGSLGPV